MENKYNCGGVDIGFRGKRRALIIEKNIHQDIKKHEWLKKVQATGGICPGCGKNVGCAKLFMDHTIPISRARPGKIYHIKDVQPLCMKCNKKKGLKTIRFPCPIVSPDMVLDPSLFARPSRVKVWQPIEKIKGLPSYKRRTRKEPYDEYLKQNMKNIDGHP